MIRHPPLKGGVTGAEIKFANACIHYESTLSLNASIYQHRDIHPLGFVSDLHAPLPVFDHLELMHVQVHNVWGNMNCVHDLVRFVYQYGMPLWIALRAI